MSGSSVPSGVAVLSTTVGLEPPPVRRLGDLQADVAAADDDDAADPSGVELGAQRLAVPKRLNSVDAVGVDAGDGGAGRHASRWPRPACRTARYCRGPVVGGAHDDPPRGQVDLLDVVPDAHVDAEPVAEHLRRPGDQTLARAYDRTDPVRDAAGGVGGEGPAFEGDDLQVVRASPPACLGRGAHAAGVATDDHQSVRHGTTVRLTWPAAGAGMPCTCLHGQVHLRAPVSRAPGV